MSLTLHPPSRVEALASRLLFSCVFSLIFSGQILADTGFGKVQVACDVNGDGRDDVFVGAPDENSKRGAVYQYTAAFLSGNDSSAVKWSQSTVGVPGSNEVDDRFGSALAAGDFNGDGLCDIAIAAPYEDLSGKTNAGNLVVLYGDIDGLNQGSRTAQSWNENSSGIKGVAETGDHLGSALAVGDFNGDGRDDLAIGIRDENVGRLKDAGSVLVLYGSSGGLTSTDQVWTENSPGIKGVSEAYDRLGDTLAAGDFNNDGYEDLAIGITGEDVGSIKNAGSVLVLFGAAGGLSSKDQVWTENSSGIKGVSEAYDYMGSALATGDFDGDNYADLAIGLPYENLGSKANTGTVLVLYGNDKGLSSRDQLWHENSRGVKGVAEAGDHFGAVLLSVDFDNDGHDELVVGIPDENIGSIKDTGTALVLYGGSSGLTSDGELLSQNGGDFKEVPFIGEQFGTSLVAADIRGDGDLSLFVGVLGQAAIQNKDGVYYFDSENSIIQPEPVIVNHPPIASSISISSDSSLPFIEQNLIATDEDNDSLIFDLVSEAVGDGYSQAYINPQSGVLYLTPVTNFTGTISISYRVSDGQFYSDTAVVTIQILPVMIEENNLGAESMDPAKYAGFEIITFNGDLLGVANSENIQPPSVDLSANFPEPGDQGAQGSCVGWAAAYALKSYQEVLEIGWTPNTVEHIFSPSYIYNQIKLGSCQDGSYINDALELIVDQGVSTLSTMPYDQYNCSTSPSISARQEASNYKGLRTARVNGTRGIKAALANRLPVIIGMKVYNQLYELNGPDSVYNTTSGENLGGHAVTIVGYDDSRYGGAFRVINSWSKNWGDGGYFWLPYAAAQDVIVESWVLEDLENTAEIDNIEQTEPISTDDLPNLQVQSWTVDYNPTPGGDGSLQYTIINTGLGLAPKGADVTLMLSRDINVTANDFYVVYEDIIYDLETGTTVYRDQDNALNFNLPSTLDAGVYYMGLWVDDLREVEESNENDNISIDSDPLNISDTKPDISVWTWYATWDSYGNGTLTYDVRNIGAVDLNSTDWDINLVLSRDEYIGNGDEWFLFYEDADFPLPANGGGIIRDSGNPAYFNINNDQFGENIPAGTYFMGLWVDDLEQVDESNELNNYSLGAERVAIGPLSASSNLASIANENVYSQNAYNGKKLSAPNLIKVEVEILPGGQRKLKVIQNQDDSALDKPVYQKKTGSNNTVIFPVTNKYAMP